MAKRLDANAPAKDVNIVELNINNINDAVPLPVKSVDTKIVQPVDIQNRLAVTIQTHSAVLVGATTGYATSSWIDCDGFSEIAITLMNDAATNSYGDIQWSHDGSTWHGTDSVLIPANSVQRKVANTTVKARYAKVALGNTDGAPHTMNAWAYLKA